MDWDSLSDKLGNFGEKTGNMLKGVFGSRNERAVKTLSPQVAAITALESWAQGLSHEQCLAKTEELRKAVQSGEKDLDEVLPEAFALVREASVRTLGLRHYDVQLVGGIVLHKGAIAEMMTGEGKTLVATLPLYLNALTGKACYLVTVNDYLARRDAAWMAPIFEYLGMTVGAIQSSMSPWERQPVYACDIVYGTNNEFGFDYLRDNMKTRVEEQVQKLCNETGIGAQFGGKYFAHDVRVIRLPRHGASCPIGMGVSCSADRNIKGRIDAQGLWIEQLEMNPEQYLLEAESDGDDAVQIDIDQPMDAIRAALSQHPVKTRVSLTGTLIVARDIAHARIRAMLEAGEDLPAYLREHPVYYAGPAKKPEGMPSGSFGPTTAQRMDPYVDLFQSHGGSLVMLAKGNRSQQVTDACQKYGGFYLGSIGGPAAILAQESITEVTVLDFEELGMEAVWKIRVKDFPAFILVDDKGNDFFQQL